ncbi:MAG: DUF3791 domain-containing protein [Clostridia bacterium]|nr:DUF3791 domain-containing protein [Clostridia bacterium]
MQTNTILSKQALDFSIFCIENLAIRMKKSPDAIYDALTQKSDILDSYIIPCWDVLHTQGKKYIVDDLEALMREKGVVV